MAGGVFSFWRCSRFETNKSRRLVGDTEALKLVAVEGIRYWCEEPKKGDENVTPTVYDVVMLQTMNRFPVDRKMEMHRALRDFHAGRGEEGLVLFHELELLRYLSNRPNRRKEEPLELALALAEKYKNTRSEHITQLYHFIAEQYIALGDNVTAKQWCDRGVKRFPKSLGGVECYNLRGNLMKKVITASFPFNNSDCLILADRENLVEMRVKNVDSLCFRIIPRVNPKTGKQFVYHNDEDRAVMVATQPLRWWTQAVAPYGDYAVHRLMSVLPAMPAGEYLLLVSPDRSFAREGFVYVEYTCTSAMMLVNGLVNEKGGYLMRAADGTPIAGHAVQAVKVEWNNGKRDTTVIAWATTDGEGHFGFDINGKRNVGMRFIAEYEGIKIEQTFGEPYSLYADDGEELVRVESIYKDRPIYRPGDTLRFGFLAYAVLKDFNRIAMPAGRRFIVYCADDDSEEMDSTILVTDDFGSAEGEFILPKEMKPGMCFINIRGLDEEAEEGYTEIVRVEAYKQPTLTVALTKGTAPVARKMPAFGEEVTVVGLATTYTRMPVGQAQVEWKVVRNALYPWWWRGGGVRFNYGPVVATGTTMTDADGHFTVQFVAQPDSGERWNESTCYRYTVEAKVTDIAGETQVGRCEVRVGFRNEALTLSVPARTDMLDTVRFRYADLDGKGLEGRFTLSVERMRPIQDVRLRHPGITDTLLPPMSREEFARRFPQYYYTVPDTVYDFVGRQEFTSGTESNAQFSVLNTQLAAGTYRLILSGEGLADTAVVVYTPKGCKKVQGGAVVWSDISVVEARVGETVTLRVGSRHKGVRCICQLLVGDRLGWQRPVMLNDQIKEIPIPVTKEMQGKFVVTLTAVKEGQIFRERHEVDVPRLDKQLKIDIETFRDMIEPGNEEQWTLRVSRQEASADARLCLTMYDRALDSYENASLGWSSISWDGTTTPSTLTYYMPWSMQFSRMGSFKSIRYKGPVSSVWSIKGGRVVSGSSRYGYVTMQGNCVKSAVGGIGYAPRSAIAETVVLEREDEEEEIFSVQLIEPDKADDRDARTPYIRTNTGTLAFFVPALQTDATGTAVYRFRVPDLLTQWRLEGMAWTRDLAFGRLSRTLTTQKKIMVQPNSPRFVQVGDTLMLAARVSNMTDDTVEATVRFFLGKDDATGATASLTLLPRATQPASAQVVIPEGTPDTLLCRIIARTEGHSDGVQVSVPVRSNRMEVTQSYSLYLNTQGEKHYALPLKGENPKDLTIEYTANPMDLALSALHHIDDRPDPSNIHLVNTLFVNSIADSVPPTATLQTLFDNQLPDGGWSWMPKGHISSEYVTQYILKLLAQVKTDETGNAAVPPSEIWSRGRGLATAKALRYLDSLAYRSYLSSLERKFLLSGRLDYLYTRSFYPREPFGQNNFHQAYKSFYEEALKSYRKYETLYEQAILALVLHRGGNDKEARDLIRRIKEKALYSDEMGMYWRDNRDGQSSGFWHQRPVELQSLLIQSFREVTPDDAESLALMQLWLIKQKQTTRWDSDVATAHAVMALSGTQASRLQHNDTETPTLSIASRPLLHFPVTFPADSIPLIAPDNTLHVTLTSSRNAPSWGAVFYRYEAPMDSVAYTATGITCRSDLFVVRPDGTLKPVADTTLRVGMRLRRVFTFSTDRNLEYVELTDPRATCFEPVSTASGWTGPLYTHVPRSRAGVKVTSRMHGYYQAVRDMNTSFYIDRLERPADTRAQYSIETDYYLMAAGSFTLAPPVLQCLYAPEFRATLPTTTIQVQ